jgi:hypothetical protein
MAVPAVVRDQARLGRQLQARHTRQGKQVRAGAGEGQHRGQGQALSDRGARAAFPGPHHPSRPCFWWLLQCGGNNSSIVLALSAFPV